MGIEQVPMSARSPWQNPYVEQVIGSIRRECLDHVITFNEWHLRGVLRSYFEYYEYYHGSRTHLGLEKDCPLPRRIERLTSVRSTESRWLAGCITGTSARLLNSNQSGTQDAPDLARRVGHTRLVLPVSEAYHRVRSKLRPRDGERRPRLKRADEILGRHTRLWDEKKPKAP